MDGALTPEQARLQDRARALAEDHVAARAAEIDETRDYPWDTVERLKQAGFMGMTVPEPLGGQGLGFLEASLAIEEFARVCAMTGRIVVESNMGAISAVMAYGTEAQKQQWADGVLGGDKPAICITEPEAGSAASELTTRADRRGGEFVVNGRKHWITGGGVSRLHLIFARVFDERGEEEGIAGFIATRDETPGLVVGSRERTMGLRGIPETEILFEDMVVPRSAMVVPPRGLRKGFADLMNAYNSQRVGAATVALGVAAGAFDHALDYAKTREQFGRPICEFQGLQWMLADMSIEIEAARAMIRRAALSAGDGFPDMLKAAQAKVLASEMAIRVTNDALQIFGAAGYSQSRPLERMVRDARMFAIGGGTAQILRTLVAGRLLERRLPQTRDGYARGEAETGGKAARRQAREAAALRQNLKRRKAQGRARDAADADRGAGAGVVETP
ncbi:MAG: acyl-CoA dehydrogenase family protein [Defluviicoccus sp.]|nr:acyl-CoA dehydrogenase family protein [Defluviicoccus sp.]